MAYAEVLQELARQVRGDTLRVVEATKADWLRWAPAGTSNHILWHAGHALWLQDLMGVELLSGQSELPVGWSETFGARSQPNTINQWPTREDMRSLLETQLVRLMELLDSAADDQLLQTPTRPSAKRTRLGWIIHGLHDEAKHNGEMYLLWKLCHQQN